MTNRPQGMSQLDYLWTHFGAYEVSNETSQVPSDKVILTEQALANFLQESTEGGIVSLTYRKHPTKEGVMQLIGTSVNGSELTVVEMPEEVHVQSFQRRKITQEDIDNGFDYPIDSDALSITLTNGQEFIVSMMDIDLMISARDTNTIHTEVTNGVISSELRVDTRNNDISVVPINTTSNGIYADIKISEANTGVKIIKENDGISAYIPIGDSKVGFQQLTLDQYLVLEPKDMTTFYLITDVPYIYFGGVRYGSGLETSDTPIVSLVYDADHMLLSYKKVGENVTQIHLGPADENLPGMMSTESYVDLQNLKNKLGEVDSIPDYIDERVDQLAYSLELGEPHDNTRPLRLIAKNGSILSTIDLDVENFLQQAENKIATAQDVIDSGETVVEGHRILVLTLTSGDKVYVDLNSLVTDFTVSDTDTIDLNLVNNNFTANLKINNGEKMIHSGPNGIQSYWQVVQEDNTVTFYGLNQTLEYRLGQIVVPDVLQEFQFKDQITAEEVIQFPPRTVDCVDYDYDTNPVIIGDPYIILGYGTDDTIHYEYISIKPLYQAIQLSQKEHNTLTKGDDGFLYNEDKSVVSGELEGGILTLHLGNDTTVLIPLPEATSESSGLLSAQDKAKLEVLLSEGDGSISEIQSDLEKVISDVDNIGNVIIPEMNENTAKALDGKVDWDETKTIITLPKNGAISALRNEETLEGGNLLAQRTYDGGTTYVSEVGTTKNKLTLNASERPQIDIQGQDSEKLAYESEVQLVPTAINIPIRSLKDEVYDKETVLSWFGVSEDSELKNKIANKGIQYIKYGLTLTYNPHYYKMPVEYIAYESNNQIKLVFNGLDTSNDVPSKYEIIINTDGTIIEGNSNVKLTITPLSTQPEEIQDQIQSNIVQELGQDTTKVISQKVVTDNISKIDAAILEMIPLSQKGSVNGVASLDENGKIPSTQLPGFVDDVLEYDNFEAFPETGETGKIYVTKDTNLEYRWSGTQYTQISKSVGLGETSSTAYAGDKGKQVTDRVAEVYSANSVINGLSDITFDSDDTEAQTLSADNALKTWDGSGTSHDMKIPYATIAKAGVMSASDKSKLDQLTEGLSDDTPSMSEVVENINTITQNITGIQGDITNIENSIGDTSNLTTEATNLTDAINEHETQIDTISNDVFNLKNNTVKSVQVGTNEATTPVEGLVTIPNATSEADGTMSKEDKTKLDILNKITFDYDQLIAAETTPNIELYDNIRKAYSSGLQPILVYDEGTQQHYYPCSIIAYQGSSGSRIYYLKVNRSDIYAKDLETWNFSIIRNGTVSYTDSKLDLSYLNTDGDGTQFLADDGTYKEIIIPESTLSDDYTASAESSEPVAGDTYETAISKLHKTILDLTSRIADLEQALTLKTI